MKRFQRIVFDNGEQLVKVVNSSINYSNPPIPDGYIYILGEWHNGFVIQRVSDGSEFVWVPVGRLEPEGLLAGSFSQAFGRRNFEKNVRFFEFDEPLEGELLDQLESVEKYGGFYISRYNISKGLDGKPHSVQSNLPWTDISFYEAKRIAATIENNEEVKSHLTFGSEYDSVLEWFIESGSKTLDEIANDSTSWGNYLNAEGASTDVAETGSSKKWCANNIYDFAGNVSEWTQENGKDSKRVIRGGYCLVNGHESPVAIRISDAPHETYFCNSFRVALCIK